MPEQTATPRAATGGRIAALDGIRALAVLAVILFHLHVPGVAGGFVGVDVFFVLSGFLITGLLLHDVRRTGSVRLARFWTRRFRRLMPAFVTMILVVMAWAATMALPVQRDGLRADAVWSLLYVGNWHFVQTASYFESSGTPSPLQHVWSLAVEEQFYVFWPLLVALAGLVVHRWLKDDDAHSRVVRTVGWGAGLLAVGSAVLLAVLADPQAPDRAYMGTDTRAFEPLAGAALACLVTAPRVREWTRRWATPLLAVGLLTLVVGAATLGTFEAGASATYFDGGAVAFTLGSLALVAGAASGSGGALTGFLASRPMAWIGQISYGIYLWHWPLRVWLIPDGSFRMLRAPAVIVLSVLIAAVSYYVVERPVREGRLAGWLTARRTLATAAGVLAVSLALTGFIKAPEPVPGRSLVLVGDSVPKRFAPMLAAWAQNDATYSSWTIGDGSVGGCPGMPIDPRLGDAATPSLKGANCPKAVTAAQAKAFAAGKPDIVTWWSRAEEYDRLGPDGQFLAVGTPAFWAAQRADLRARLAYIEKQTGATVVLIGTDRPGKGMLSRCTPTDCHPFLRRLVDRDDLRTAWNAILRQEAARDPKVAYVEVDDVYCHDAGEPCDDTIPGEGFARPDGSHFSEAGADLLAKPFLDRVIAASRTAATR